MSSSPVTARVAPPGAVPPEHTRRVSSGLMLAGAILLLLALALFLYAMTHHPTQVPVEAGLNIEAPGVGPSRPPLPASAPSGEPRAKPNEKRNTTSNKLHHPRLETPSMASEVTPQGNQESRKPCATGRATGNELVKKVGFFTRLGNLIKKLFGRRPAPQPLNSPPIVKSFTRSSASITLPCPEDKNFDNYASAVQLITTATDNDLDTLSHTYSVSGGRIIGVGPDVTWDLAGVHPGTYTATVEVDDGCVSKSASTTVTISDSKCVRPVTCPTISVGSADRVTVRQPITFTADVQGGEGSWTYNWTVSAGVISDGQGTSSIRVDTAGVGSQPVTATVELGGLDPGCSRTASSTTQIVAMANGGGHRQIVKLRNPSTGQPISGASLQVFAPAGQSVPVTTLADGDFSFPMLARGDYRLVITRGSNTQVMMVNSEQSSPLEIQFTVPVSTSSPTPTPVASPGTTASPTPTVSATATPTPPDKVKEQDQIKAEYPSYVAKDRNSTVSFELNRVWRDFVPSHTNTNGNFQVTDRPPSDPHGSPDVPISAGRGDQYTAHATVTLIATGVTIISAPEKAAKSLEPKHVKWSWDLKPVDDLAETASFTFHVDIVWREKESGREHQNRFSFDWPKEPFQAPIGPPTHVKAAKYGSPFVAAAGLLTFGLGRRRRKSLQALAVAEEAIVEETVIGEEEEVSATVFAPQQALPGNSFLVQVFAHLAEEASALEGIAKQSDKDAKEVVQDSLEEKIKRGTRLTFILTMPGLEIDEPQQSRVWSGKRIRVQFGVTVPKDFEPKDIVGKVIVCEKLTPSAELTAGVTMVPLGHLRFKFQIGKGASEAKDVPVAVGTVTRYNQAFISYAHEDQSEVLKRVQMLDVQRQNYFLDFITLRSGDKWEQLLNRYVDESDVFYLFWSRAASKSVWVNQEIDRVVKRQAGNQEAPPEIYPVVIEVPPPEERPAKLGHLQFDDKFTRLIFAADAVDRARDS